MDIIDNTEVEQAWASLAAQAADIDNEINPVNETLPVNESQPHENEPSTADLLAPVIKVTGDIFAPNWNLSADECEQLGNAYGGLIDKYLPDNPAAKYGMEISAVMITLAVFSSRKGTPLKIETKQESIESKAQEKPSVPDEKQVTVNKSASGVLMPKAVNNES
jgi:hypothetical protein